MIFELALLSQIWGSLLTVLLVAKPKKKTWANECYWLGVYLAIFVTIYTVKVSTWQ